MKIKKISYILIILFLFTSCKSDFNLEKKRMDDIYTKTIQAIEAKKFDEAEMLSNQLIWTYVAQTVGGVDEVLELKKYWENQKEFLDIKIEEKREIN